MKGYQPKPAATAVYYRHQGRIRFDDDRLVHRLPPEIAERVNRAANPVDSLRHSLGNPALVCAVVP